MEGRNIFNGTAWLVALAVSMLWIGCASAPPPNVKMVECSGPKIEWQVAPEAEITSFACAFGPHQGDPSLIFTVGLKNAGQQPARFRLGVYLPDMGKAVAYLVPTKGAPPQLAPGQDQSVKIPFMKTTTMPAKVMVRVIPMSAE